MNATEALEILVEQQTNQQPDQGEQTALSLCAAMALRGKGEFVFAEVGAWQAKGVDCVRYVGNTLLTQATKPVKSGHASIYLRDRAVHPRPSIELVWSDDPNQQEPNRTGDLVLATFGHGQFDIPGMLKPTPKHYEAAQQLVGLIERELEPLDETGVDMLPTVLFGDALDRGVPRVTNLNKSSGMLLRELEIARPTLV